MSKISNKESGASNKRGLIIKVSLAACAILFIVAFMLYQSMYSYVDIPADVKYTAKTQQVIPEIKRSVVVHLNKKVSKQVLASIAKQIKSKSLVSYKRTFITYYLPNMTEGYGAWATTHFDPYLEVKILGSTAEQEKSFTASSKEEFSNSIGIWMDESPYVASVITIFSKNGKFFLNRKYIKDNSSSLEEVVKRGNSFYTLDSDTYFLIDSQENLQIRDNEGLIVTAVKR